MLTVSEAVLLEPSRTVIVTTLVPASRRIDGVVQLVVPTAAPLGPRSLDHITCVMPESSDAVPLMVTAWVLLVKLDPGDVIVMTGS